ncbi:MAG: hypothetical protein JO043_02120, partial [Candidatus Eremiobacteraeota bacterium]|nr:hypothetical protein [Candidatus Eremiobacteraeota bacterium]
MSNIIRTTSVLCMVSLATGVGLSISSASAATLRTVSVPSQTATASSGPFISLKGHRIRVGWAAARLRKMQRFLPQPFSVPANPLYVADPGLNGVVIFNKLGNGVHVPSAFLAGP